MRLISTFRRRLLPPVHRWRTSTASRADIVSIARRRTKRAHPTAQDTGLSDVKALDSKDQSSQTLSTRAARPTPPVLRTAPKRSAFNGPSAEVEAPWVEQSV